MRFPLAPLAAVAVALTFSAAPDPLRVLRSAPGAVAAPTDTLLVSFDRPIAGALDDAVDPQGIVEISPAVAARFEWRDPVTLQIIPAAPLPRGGEFTVRVRTDFRAMDGSSLAAPHLFRFRVRGPTLIAGDPLNGADTGRFVAQTPRWRLVYDAPVMAEQVARTARAVPTAQCRSATGRAGTVQFRAVNASGAPSDTVEVEAQSALPPNCLATLVIAQELALGAETGAATGSSTGLSTGASSGVPSPAAAGADTAVRLLRWPFRTHGAFAIDSVQCLGATYCPLGPLLLRFSTPVRGTDLARALAIAPAVPLSFDTAATSDRWRLTAALSPRTAYALIANRGLRDVFGQSLTGNPSTGVRTTGYAPSVQAPFGRLMVERSGFRTLAVRTMNVDTLLAERLAVPDSAVAQILAGGEWSWREYWVAEASRRTRTRTPLLRSRDRARVVAVPVTDAVGAPSRSTTLQLVRVRDAAEERREVEERRSRTAAQRAREGDEEPWYQLALVQVTDLGVHAKIGDDAGAVWVTDARTGRVRAGAQVVLYDAAGAVLATATTNSDGLAALSNYAWRNRATLASNPESGMVPSLEEGYVSVRIGDDQAVLPIRYADPDLAPWRFGVAGAYGVERATIAAALFTERDLYRPGEQLFAKAIVRSGALGALDAPQPSDTVRWIRRDREYQVMDSVVTTLSEFGTADIALPIAADAGIGRYDMALEWRHRQEWTTIARSSYRIAEYRPPAFLVELATTRPPNMPGDTLGVHLSARYLFGGAMAGAAVSWSLTSEVESAAALGIAGTDSWLLGDEDAEWQESARTRGPRFITNGQDSLSADGRLDIFVAAPEAPTGNPSRLSLVANVSDVNRQLVGARTTAVVHPAAFYLAAQPVGDEWFWRANVPRAVRVKSVRPSGERVSGVRVDAVLVRREWHRVERIRGGTAEMVGEWVADTVSRCTVTTSLAEALCTVTPTKGGAHSLILRSRDAAGRDVVTAATRWVTGPDWVPWNDDNQLKLDVIADREQYAPGDTATIMFASPFTDAEAWITVEREGVLEQRRQRLTSGSTTLRLPITAAHAPNVFVSMLVARGRSEAPTSLGDPGRPTIRVGYVQLRVTPQEKRLHVAVAPDRAEYRPGDTARITVQVNNAAGTPVRSELTLWAVDEGVLSLTGFRTPDPLELLYQPRGVGLTLASTLANVAPQLPEGEKATREPGGGGGSGDDGVLRSRFRTTAFFLGSVVTDANGLATAAAPLPDNLTTFRVMAVAVTRGDRFGSGDTALLVTRPLVVRAALPRFVRAGDEVHAGATVNRQAIGGRDAQAQVRVDARVEGAELLGGSRRTVRVEAGRAAEVRFRYRVPPGDEVLFRFDARSGNDRDAVQLRIPVRPDARAITTAQSAMAATATTLSLPVLDNLDLTRSTVTIAVGGSPLALVQAALERARVYPWNCSEQVASTALPVIALLAAEQFGDSATANRARADVTRAVRALQQRQRYDGGIGYWGATDWTTPWLSAHAALMLVDARAAGVAVDSAMLTRLADYLTDAVGEPLNAYAPSRGRAPISRSYANPTVVLSEYVAAAEALRALGRPNLSAENDLVRNAGRLSFSDRARLARLLAERGNVSGARALLVGLWARVQFDERRAFLRDSANEGAFYFATPLRATSALLRATLAVDPNHTLIAPLLETVVQTARGGNGWFAVTPDMAEATRALAAVHARQSQATPRGVRIAVGNNTLLALPPMRGARDTTFALRDVVGRGRGQRGDTIALRILPEGDGEALFVSASLTSVASAPPARPLDRGITVERWTEDPTTGRTILQAEAGALVRVRLRITVPFERHFVSVEDPLPAGLEPVDLSLRTAVLTATAPPAGDTPVGTRDAFFYGSEDDPLTAWSSGRWDAGYWTPFEHREVRDDRVTWSATTVFPGRFTLSYLARATSPGVFVRPAAFAEEMYDPSIFGRTEGGVFTVVARP